MNVLVSLLCALPRLPMIYMLNLYVQIKLGMYVIHHSSYPLGVCSYCQSFDHDVNSCPYCDVSDNLMLSLMP